MNAHEKWMRMALALARRGRGTTSPNPMVGAVLVHRGKAIGQGFHRYAGGPHAEVIALRKLRRVPEDAILYVTLEPCSSEGRTPPCTDLILRKGVRRVVVGCMDLNPRHCGRGIQILRRQGVKVITDVLREECEGLNPAFAKYITRGIPLGIGKMAMSLDGKIATRTGDSQWISSKQSRHLVQRMRHAVDAVLVGAGTVSKDNPRMTIRARNLPAKKRPFIRIVADSVLAISPNAKILKPVRGHEIWIATARGASSVKARRLERKGARILRVQSSRAGISIRDLFRQLGKREITSVLVEGGPEFLASCLREKVLDDICLFVAPVIVGGEKAPGPVGGLGVAKITSALRCKNMTVQKVGRDLLIEAQVAGVEGREAADV